MANIISGWLGLFNVLSVIGMIAVFLLCLGAIVMGMCAAVKLAVAWYDGLDDICKRLRWRIYEEQEGE